MIRNRGQELYEACDHEQWDVAKKLLNQNLTKEEVNCADFDEHVSILHLACEHHQFEIIDTLLKKGANANALDVYDCSPLIDALDIDEDAACIISKMLITNGANVNCTNEFGETPLTLVTSFEWIKMMHLLLDYGADPNLITTKSTNLTFLLTILSQRESCRLGAIETSLCLRKILGRDVANMIGRMIWSQRTDNCWSDRKK